MFLRSPDTKAMSAARPPGQSSTPPPAMPGRHSRLLQIARRLSLGLSLGLVVIVPWWHLSAAHNAFYNGGRWYQVGQWLFLPISSPQVLGAPWSLKILGIEFLDPLAGLSVFTTGQGSIKILLGLIPTVLLVALAGRFFCGWLCPYAILRAASNIARQLLYKLGLKPLDVPLPRKLGILVLALVLTVAAFSKTQIAALIYPPAIISREVLHALFFGTFEVGAWFLVAAWLFDTLVARAGFCRYLCPGGALFSLLSAISPLRVVRKPQACTNCAACDRVCNFLQHPHLDQNGIECERCGQCVAVCAPKALSFGLRWPFKQNPQAGASFDRRVILGALPVMAAATFWSRKKKETRLRPPNAAPHGQFASRCIRCQRCLEVCPVKAIRFDQRGDLRDFHTPYIEPRTRACILCMKCVQACPTEALLPIKTDLEQARSLVRMGHAIHQHRRCIAWNREGLCRLCYYVCPFPDRAIVLTGPNQAPSFVERECVGCGQCEEACPQRASAVHIEP